MRFKIDRASRIVGSKFNVFALFYFAFEDNFPSTSHRGAYIWRCDFTEGFLRYRFGWLIFGGLIFGFYGMIIIPFDNTTSVTFKNVFAILKEHGHDSRACSSSRNAFGRDATLVPGVFVPLDQRSGACAVRNEDSRYEIEERRIGKSFQLGKKSKKLKTIFLRLSSLNLAGKLQPLRK